MTGERDSKGELRAAFTMRAIDNAKRSCNISTGNLFARVALALIFMYLLVISHMMLGAIGPVFISLLVLVAYFVPVAYQALRSRTERKRALEEDRTLGWESPQEG